MLSLGSLRRALCLFSLVGAAGLLGIAPAAADEPEPRGETRPASTVDPPPPAEEAPRPAAPAKKRRGGVHPCMTPDPGFGIYDGWNGSGMSVGQVLLPHQGGIGKNGQFDVVIHFHGPEPIRREFVKTAKGIVLVGVDLGIGSGAYQSTFSAPSAFTNLLASVEAAVAKHAGRQSAHIRKLALSSWSAGYGAIEQILRQPAGKKVDALILLDSLHAGYSDEQTPARKVEQLSPFIAFAKRAASKQAFMFMSHSSIIPPGYASTTEVASFVVGKLGGKPKSASRQDVLGLEHDRPLRQGLPSTCAATPATTSPTTAPTSASWPTSSAPTWSPAGRPPRAGSKPALSGYWPRCA